MLTREDCIALSSLTEAEITAIAAHERYPADIAAQLSHYLVVAPTGQLYIEEAIKDDLARPD